MATLRYQIHFTLGNVLARQSAIDRGAPEAVMFRDGFLTEGSASNIWMVRDGALHAPLKNHLILEGIRYGLLQELAEQHQIPVQKQGRVHQE